MDGQQLTTIEPTGCERNQIHSQRVGLYSWPPASINNPYQRLFYRSVESHGFEYKGGFDLSNAWLSEHETVAKVLHFHWPEVAWRWKGRGWHQEAIALAGFHRFLKVAKRIAVKVIWTVHNLVHHEGGNWIDRLGYRLLAGSADLLICHSEDVAQEVRMKYRPKGRLVVMPHGTYVSAYPEPRNKGETLRDLGLDPLLPTVCQLGIIRDYKGVETTAAASRLLKGRVQFIVAGHIGKHYDATRLRKIAAESGNCLLKEGFLEDQEFANIASACDAFVLPYREITGSGAALAALTFGKGVIASDLPYFRGLLRDAPEAGRLFPVGNSDACARAVANYLATPIAERELSCQVIADQHNWDECVKPVVSEIRRVLGMSVAGGAV